MADVEAIRSAIVEQHLKSLPLMDVEKVRQAVVEWLRQVKYPAGAEGSSWEDELRVFPPEDGEQASTSGVKIRLALTLHTSRHSYLITIMECLALDSREVYILSAHTNWKETEKRLQRALEEGYVGRFEDVLRARHTIWAQTFREQELADALNACALALLGNELAAHRPDSEPLSASTDPDNGLSNNDLTDQADRSLTAHRVKRPIAPIPDFPDSDSSSSD